MSNENSSTSGDGQQGNESGAHIVFINGVKHELDPDEEYTAADLIKRAGDDPSDHDLVATKGESGRDDKVFDDGEVIDFDEQHRKHFETKADGDTYI